MPDSKTKNVKKVVLAYSGGLDTSIILKWLQDTYGCEVVTFTAILARARLAPARQKALLLVSRKTFSSWSARRICTRLRLPDVPGDALYEGNTCSAPRSADR
jgi:argininosuccinate synthase